MGAILLLRHIFCRENHITILSLPPHTSHRMQPLDVVFFGPLKKVYNRECDLYMRSKPGEAITVYKIAEIFNKAYSSVVTIGKGVSGFASTGIYRINPAIISDEDFNDDHENESQNDNLPIMSTNLDDKPTKDILFQNLSPIPSTSRSSKLNNSRKQHSSILTHTPQKLLLQGKKRSSSIANNQKSKWLFHQKGETSTQK